MFHMTLFIKYYENETHSANYMRPPPELVDREKKYEVEQIEQLKVDKRLFYYLVK